jgi:branched-chain amino acid transport system permease protein
VELFFQRIVDGLSSGAIYAALALALVLIYRSTSLLNFAQGEMAMFSTFIGWMFTDAGLPVWLAIVFAMAISFLGGAVIERFLIRPVGTDNLLAIVIVTIGIFIAVNALAGWLFGTEGRTFPSAFPNERWDLGGVNVKAQLIGNLAVLFLVVGLLFLLFQKTKVGLAMRAVASNMEAARLVGIRGSRMLMLGWGMAAALGALAGCLVAPALDLSLNLMGPVLIYAFAAATLGGFDSPIGAVVGGLTVGVVQALASGYIGLFDKLDLAPAFLLILVVLLFKPAGLFGKTEVQRV